MSPRRCAAAGAVVLALGGLAGASPINAQLPVPDIDRRRAAPGPPVVVAAGDIACEPGLSPSPADHTCQHAETAQLAAGLRPTAVLVLGDAQYNTGALADYTASYDRSWGVLLPLTRPVPGNHEYLTSGARGYYRYFKARQPGPPGYYAFGVGTWRLYALNTECARIDCAAESSWLRADLRAHPRACSLIYMHQPRFSSGAEHGSSSVPRGLWRVAYRHRVDVALAGHDHGYERFAPKQPDGDRSRRRITSFVVGTGGRSLYGFGQVEPGSVARYNEDHGVLALTLRKKSYDWAFHTISGRTVDSGNRRCR